MPFAPGERIGRYDVIDRLGAGGMGADDIVEFRPGAGFQLEFDDQRNAGHDFWWLWSLADRFRTVPDC